MKNIRKAFGKYFAHYILLLVEIFQKDNQDEYIERERAPIVTFNEFRYAIHFIEMLKYVSCKYV